MTHQHTYTQEELTSLLVDIFRTWRDEEYVCPDFLHYKDDLYVDYDEDTEWGTDDLILIFRLYERTGDPRCGELIRDRLELRSDDDEAEIEDWVRGIYERY